MAKALNQKAAEGPNEQAEEKTFMNDTHSNRSRIIQIVFGLTAVIIIAQLVSLQIFDTKYKLMADNQALYRKVIYPSRGLIIDRRQTIILDNTTSYDLEVTPALVRQGIDTAALLNILNIDTTEFRRRLVDVILKNGRYRASTFEPLLDESVHAQLAEKLPLFQPAFQLVERPVRKYPFEAAAHIFGYLAEVDTRFLEKYAEEGYRQGDYAGMTGLERTYEKVLMGQRGVEYWNKDNKNRPTHRYRDGEFDTIAVSGSTMHSSLDMDLQALGEKLMEGKIGSVVAIDPKTGGILAMVSSPSFKPSLLTGNKRRKHFSELYVDPRLPLYNRAISGTYPPGSTFKTLQALVGLQEGIITQNSGYPCRGAYYECGTGRPKCHGSGHSPNLAAAIAVSCNPYFANVYRKILEQPRYGGVDSALSVWDQYMYQFGLGHPLGVDLPAEKGGMIPTPARYQKVFGSRWHACNTISNAIGQGEVTSTVLQLTNSIAMIANKGWYITPHFIDSIEGGDHFGLLKPYHRRIEPVHIADTMFEAIHEGMERVMLPGGTAWRLAIEGVRMCGKTGTTENYFRGVKQRDHSFFAAFAPRENPKIAIAAVVENGGFGSVVAAPIVSLMVEQYLNDTISKKRQDWIERYSSMRIMPARIAAEIHKRDSIERREDSIRAVKERAALRAIAAEEMPAPDWLALLLPDENPQKPIHPHSFNDRLALLPQPTNRKKYLPESGT